MEPRFLRCARVGCTRSFLYRKGKRACSDECRNTLFLERRAEKGQKLYTAAIKTNPSVYPGAAAIEPNQWKMVGPQMAIAINHPPSACGYRLGIPKEGASKYEGALRWFPNYKSVPCGVFSLRPWQFPAVPFPGEYLVAYFDQDYRLVEPPTRLVAVTITSSPDPWSSGDIAMEVRLHLQRG